MSEPLHVSLWSVSATTVLLDLLCNFWGAVVYLVKFLHLIVPSHDICVRKSRVGFALVIVCYHSFREMQG